ncbi:MAG: methyltransferase domain-containing protein [archaeon]
MKLNLGCGTDIKKGYVNMDKIKGQGIDLVWDLNKIPYPFKDNSIEQIYASNILEHIDLSIPLFLKEAKRILKKDGLLIVRVPIGFVSLSIFHKRFFSIGDFNGDVIDSEQREMWKGWKLESRRLEFHKAGKIFFLNRLVEKAINHIRADIYERSFLRSLFPAEEIFVRIRKIKND